MWWSAKPLVCFVLFSARQNVVVGMTVHRYAYINSTGGILKVESNVPVVELINVPCLLLACQVRITVGDSGLCCCVWVTSFDHQLTPCAKKRVWKLQQTNWVSVSSSGGHQDHRQDTADGRQPDEDLPWDPHHETAETPSHYPAVPSHGDRTHAVPRHRVCQWRRDLWWVRLLMLHRAFPCRSHFILDEELIWKYLCEICEM